MPRKFWICFVTLALALTGTLGCQGNREGDAPSAPPPISVATATAPYTRDITKLCDVVKLSKADADPGGQLVIIANWLAANLETKEAHDFLVRIANLVGEPKAAALDAEAHKVGLPSCALSAVWRKPR